MSTKDFEQKFQHAVAMSDAVARALGYGESVTDNRKLDVATAFKQAVDEFVAVARELASAIARTSAFLTGAGTMASQVDALKKSIETANAAEFKAAQIEADKRYQGRS